MNNNIDINSLSLEELRKFIRLACEACERKKAEEKEKKWENLWQALIDWIRAYGGISVEGIVSTGSNDHFTISIDEKCCFEETGKIFY